MEIGSKVLLKGDHPHAGKTGVIVDSTYTLFGNRPEVQLDNEETRVCIMNESEVTVI